MTATVRRKEAGVRLFGWGMILMNQRQAKEGI